ncbi:hypothetical protein TWF703_002763 [Orbilia oligospora]|uniref:F-box domain-containing protein n=1 Tax=Orbilia oligospora TaxID=2813651 RepID=A0A7C8K245_ORBOL|nr:hypothetical protein TWF703_002763 [Orbilia oligospora]
MASLVLLSKAPEILFQIINHLSRKDVLSLLQTCQALYPACYRNIWSSVVFNTNTNSSGVCIHPKSKRYVDLPEVLQELVESDGLDLRRIVIDLADAGSSPCLKIAQEDLLFSLETYAQSRPPGELRMEVYGGTTRRLPKFFHLESITKLEMSVEGHGRGEWPPGDTKYIGERNDRIGIEMSRLASLLPELPNLEVFSWRDLSDVILTVGCFPIFMLPEKPFLSFPEERKKLQIAFLGMRKLVELKFYNLFFDPSFFVIPPENTRKLVIGIEIEKARERAGEIMKENTQKLAEHASYVSRALEAECVTKILAIPDHEGDRRKQEFAQEYASVFMNSFTGAIDLSSFTSARENARSLSAKTNEYFEEIIRRITEEMEDTYTIKFAHGVENDDKCEQEFRSQCREKLNKWMEMENDSSKYDLFNARNLT